MKDFILYGSEFGNLFLIRFFIILLLSPKFKISLKMLEIKPQCLTCRHNMKLSSCAPCTDKGAQIIENLALDFEKDISSTEEQKIITLKYSCKILMNNPEDFKSVDPYNCKYFLSSAFKFF